ncbi:MAG TPA: GIY-YIG nuclease family protein [Clostridia bacterium]|nr:GIY-YIG nuclease family protein [Clostridia bacterium]
MDRRKELKLQYKQTRPKMGIFIIRSKANNKCHIQGTKDLKGVMNGARVRLGGNMHVFKELQKEWNELGPENFTFEILEYLEYDKDEAKTDYTEELKLLEMIWEEKLAAENLVLYRKHI